MDEQTRQIRYLIVIAAVICAVMIGYNAFYVPDAPLAEPVVAADASSASEEYTPASAMSGGSSAAVSAASAVSAEAGETRVSSKKPEKPASGTAGKLSGKININTATAQQLSDGLDGIGGTLAERIVEYRERNGAFRSIDQIKNVSGVGDKKFEAIRGSITVG